MEENLKIIRLLICFSLEKKMRYQITVEQNRWIKLVMIETDYGSITIWFVSIISCCFYQFTTRFVIKKTFLEILGGIFPFT